MWTGTVQRSMSTCVRCNVPSDKCDMVFMSNIELRQLLQDITIKHKELLAWHGVYGAVNENLKTTGSDFNEDSIEISLPDEENEGDHEGRKCVIM